MARNLLRWAAEFGRVSAAKVLTGPPRYQPQSSPGPRNFPHSSILCYRQRPSRNRPPPAQAARYKTKPEIRWSNAPPRSHILWPHVHSPITTRAQAVDRNAKDGYHRTPLSAAIWRGRAKIARLILQQSFIDITWIDFQGRIAASYAAQRGYLGILRALYKRDDTVLDNVDKHGQTLLIWTARNGYAQTVRFILEHRGGNLDRQDKFGYMGLIMAVRKERLAVVRADVRVKDKDGRTALWFARDIKYRNRDIEKILVEVMGSNSE